MAKEEIVLHVARMRWHPIYSCCRANTSGVRGWKRDMQWYDPIGFLYLGSHFLRSDPKSCKPYLHDSEVQSRRTQQ
jgi:hypothetical protein